MKLTREEEALRGGEFGPARQWAIGHQIKVGSYLGALDFVPVTQAHVMADTESLGVAGVEWLERMADLPLEQRRGRHSNHPGSPRHGLWGGEPLEDPSRGVCLGGRAVCSVQGRGVLVTG